ncbi:zinc ribbon domain-containing protein [Miltoncostaea marina]|uniref:zinc ribbon domain-containing protein n=1 Tax=Miltoncostaea marina TaxID=2843215 RepID=UPI001C3CC359|nr:zinc ribbon domain-containing protein [Miltoncostaea marina]
MRAESDLQGHHRSETPACHRCGLPLLAEARFCPYCERWLDEGGLPRLLSKARVATDVRQRRFAGVPERVLLMVGLVLFTLVAAASIVAAVAT